MKRKQRKLRKDCKCDCTHTQEDHYQNEGASKKCACTWFGPNIKRQLRKQKQLKLDKEKTKTKTINWNLVKDIIHSCKTGELSESATVVAISLAVCPQPNLTKAQIAHAKKLQPMARKILKKG